MLQTNVIFTDVMFLKTPIFPAEETVILSGSNVNKLVCLSAACTLCEGYCCYQSSHTCPIHRRKTTLQNVVLCLRAAGDLQNCVNTSESNFDTGQTLSLGLATRCHYCCGYYIKYVVTMLLCCYILLIIIIFVLFPDR